MIIRQYKVTLKRVEAEDIELIRYWRNHSSIASYMEFKKKITKKMQRDWFESINNKYNYYFLIIYDGKKIGLINAKNYNETERYGEGGIMIWDKDYLFSPVPVFASLALLNFVFLLMKESRYSVVKIANKNKLAIQFNRQLGYEPMPEMKTRRGFLYYRLTRENYLKKTAKLNKAAAILSGEGAPVSVSGNESELNLESINKLLRKSKA